MKEVVLAIVLAILSSGALSALISGLFARSERKKRKDTGISAGVRMLLYDKIKYLCKEHISHGYIATHDLEDLCRMHKIYHEELDGNGFLDGLMSEVHKLKVVPAFVKPKE